MTERVRREMSDQVKNDLYLCFLFCFYISIAFVFLIRWLIIFILLQEESKNKKRQGGGRAPRWTKFTKKRTTRGLKAPTPGISISLSWEPVPETFSPLYTVCITHLPYISIRLSDEMLNLFPVPLFWSVISDMQHKIKFTRHCLLKSAIFVKHLCLRSKPSMSSHGLKSWSAIFDEHL